MNLIQDSDVGKDWGQKEKKAEENEMIGQCHLLNEWTWAWANSGRQWRVGKTGMLQSMGLQRVRHKLIHKLGLFQCKLRFPLSRNPVEIKSRRVWSCVASNGKSSSDSLLNTPVIPPYLQLFSLNVLHETLALGDTDTCYGARERCHKK